MNRSSIIVRVHWNVSILACLLLIESWIWLSYQAEAERGALPLATKVNCASSFSSKGNLLHNQFRNITCNLKF